MKIDYLNIADKIIEGYQIDDNEALTLLNTEDKDLLILLAGAYKIRYEYFKNKIRLNYLVNAKSGDCDQDCAYCSQSTQSKAEIKKYPLIDKEEILKEAKIANDKKARFYCIVTSGGIPTDEDVNVIAETVKEIKSKYPLKLCSSLGKVTEKQAKILKEAGIDRFNHNINTSPRYHEEITTTHEFSDRVETLKLLHDMGIHSCSGCIVGMGETKKDIVSIAMNLRKIKPDAIPINFLMPIKGTALENTPLLGPNYCLKVVAMFRYCCPKQEIRLAGGRELQLGNLQAMGFYAANSFFISDYLTEQGQSSELDYKMIKDLGFEIER